MIERIFGDYYIATAVWQEFQKYDNPLLNKKQLKFLEKRVVAISTKNYLSVVLDYGESESIILYEELKADFLLIDDKKGKINCRIFKRKLHWINRCANQSQTKRIDK